MPKISMKQPTWMIKIKMTLRKNHNMSSQRKLTNKLDQMKATRP